MRTELKKRKSEEK